MLDSVILDPAKSITTANHHKTLQWGGPEPPSFGHLCRKEETEMQCATLSDLRTCSWSDSNSVTLQPLKNCKSSTCTNTGPEEVYKYTLVSRRPWGRLQVSSRPPFLQRHWGRKLLCRAAGSSFQGDVVSGWGGGQPLWSPSFCCVLKSMLQFSGYSWKDSGCLHPPRGQLGTVGKPKGKEAWWVTSHSCPKAWA